MLRYSSRGEMTSGMKTGKLERHCSEAFGFIDPSSADCSRLINNKNYELFIPNWLRPNEYKQGKRKLLGKK